MDEEEVARYITNRQHTQDIAVLGVDLLEIVNDIDRDEDTACQDGDTGEQPAHESQETKEGDCIETDFFDELRLFRVD